MKILKANLPEGVRKKFVKQIGKKVKLVNRNTAGKKKTSK